MNKYKLFFFEIDMVFIQNFLLKAINYSLYKNETGDVALAE